jgi:hypothetical protein
VSCNISPMPRVWVNSACIAKQRANYRARGRTRSECEYGLLLSHFLGRFVRASWFTSCSRAALAMRGSVISFLTRERDPWSSSFWVLFLAIYIYAVIKTKTIQFNLEQGEYKTAYLPKCRLVYGQAFSVLTAQYPRSDPAATMLHRSYPHPHERCVRKR